MTKEKKNGLPFTSVLKKVLMLFFVFLFFFKYIIEVPKIYTSIHGGKSSPESKSAESPRTWEERKVIPR